MYIIIIVIKTIEMIKEFSENMRTTKFDCTLKLIISQNNTVYAEKYYVGIFTDR